MPAEFTKYKGDQKSSGTKRPGAGAAAAARRRGGRLLAREGFGSWQQQEPAHVETPTSGVRTAPARAAAAAKRTQKLAWHNNI